MLGLIIGILIGCVLFIPAITEALSLDLPAWVPALAGLSFPLLFLIKIVKEKMSNKVENPKDKMSADEKKAFRDMESGPGRGPNIKL